MTIGKPFTKPTPEQIAASNAALKKDLFEIGASVLKPAVMGLAKALDEKKDTNVIAHTAHHPFIKGCAATVVMGIKQMQADVDVEAERTAREAAEAGKRTG